MAKEVKVREKMVAEPEQPQQQKSITENTHTLTTIISQSLLSGDNHLLETALGITDAATIEATLQRLPETQVGPFLDQLVHRLNYKPGRMQHLLPWIRGCISVHAPTLLSNPAARASLAPLQALIEKRLESQERLVKLAGKLDLMMMQAVRRADQGEAIKMAGLIHKPVAIYQVDDESGDDQEDLMNGIASSSDTEAEDLDEASDNDMSVDESEASEEEDEEEE